MQTSRKKERVLLIVLVAVFFIGGILLCKWAFTPGDTKGLTIQYLKELEKKGEDIDIVFVGGSRTYRSFDPDIIDAELGTKNSLNNGTPAQRTTSSYYMLKNTLEKFNPKYVIIGSTYNGLAYEQDTGYMLYYLERLSLINRLKCVFDHYSFNLGIQVLSGRELYIHNLYPSIAIDNIKKKYLYSKGVSIDKEGLEKPNGYRGEYASSEPGSLTYTAKTERGNFDEKEISPRQFEYFDKMVKLCKKKSIKVILVSGPCSLMNLYRTYNYQDAVEYYTEYAKKNGITYYNLNYIKNRDEIFPDSLFIDRIHLNKEGGEKCSRIFAKILKDELAGKDTTHYFYKDLDELKKDVHRIASCSISISCEAPNTINVGATSFHNENIIPKYRLLACPKGVIDEIENYVVIAKWSQNDKWKFTAEELMNFKKIRLEASTGEKGEVKAFATHKLKGVLKKCQQNNMNQ